MKIKLIILLSIALILLGCVSVKKQKTVFANDTSLAVITCYWTFDPVKEVVPVSGKDIPILVGFDDESIDWDNETVDRVTVAELGSSEIWFPESLWARYQMEGCGFYDSNSDGINDYVIQLNGTNFKYTGSNIELESSNGDLFQLDTNSENITLFMVIPISESAWGKAWDDQNGIETDLVPWKSAAVTNNIPTGMDRELYLKFMDGYNFI